MDVSQDFANVLGYEPGFTATFDNSDIATPEIEGAIPVKRLLAKMMSPGSS
ncbi:hypothetical protein GO281_04451 [Ralstonia solanacearum]|nr:hypothetical protein [Ralstonia solanacearum]NKA60676.1 hypothetical protein [Ralstonia solanacearum]NKF76897.1 hypothetical protein [Ralstonia solanacearum]NKF84036.1 hypothetical protein [Ralstonia solanacearum]